MTDTLTIYDLQDALADLYEEDTHRRRALPEKGDQLTLPSSISPEAWGVTAFSYIQHYRDGTFSAIIHPDLMDFLEGRRPDHPGEVSHS